MTTEQGMVKTMTIEGMMCGHCEARVKKTLEAIEGVASAEVSHEKGTAVVTLTAPVSDDVLKTAVEAQDYTVKESSKQETLRKGNAPGMKISGRVSFFTRYSKNIAICSEFS